MRQSESFRQTNNGNVSHGAAVLQKLFMRIGQEWEGFAVNPGTYTVIDGGVLMEDRYTGTYRPTGRPIDLQVAHVLKMRSNKLIKFQQYVDTAALQAAMIPGGALAAK